MLTLGRCTAALLFATWHILVACHSSDKQSLKRSWPTFMFEFLLMMMKALCRIRWQQMFALAITVGLLPANFIVLHQLLSASSTDDNRPFPANGQGSFLMQQRISADSLAANNIIEKKNKGAMPSTTKSTMMTCLMAAAHQSRRVFFGKWRCGI